MINDHKLFDKIKWKPHTGQEDILKANVRDVAICAGRRWGKSAVCAYLALKTLFEPDKKIWLVAPSYDLTRKVFDYVVKWFLMVVPSATQTISTRPFPKINFVFKNSKIECKSAENPTSLLGEEVDLLIIDEAAQISKRVYEQYLFPTTSSRIGKTIFCSTPFGKNWFFHKFVWCQENGLAFNFPSNNNPFFPAGEWERTKNMLPERVFKQEYQAKFLDDAASVFRGIRSIVKDNTYSDAITGRQYVMGVDFGKHEDFTVLTVIDRYNHNVVFWDRFNKIDYPYQKKRILAISQRYNHARAIVDSTVVGEPIKEDLERDGVFVDDFKFSNQSKKELVEKLGIFIEQKKVWIPYEDILIDELESFGYRLSDAGNVIYKAPEGLHDDCVMSLALAVWGLPNSTPKILNPIQEEILINKINKPKKRYI